MPDVSIEDFFGELFPPKAQGLIELRALPSKARLFVEPDDDRGIRQFLRQHQDEGDYFGVATRGERGDGSLSNCLDLWAVFADIDFKTASRSEAERRLAEFPLDTSIEVATGGGIHVYWLLERCVDVQLDQERIYDVLRRLAHHLGADRAAAEPARVLRIPGTWNHKYQPERSVFIDRWNPHNVYDLAEFEHLLPPLPDRPIRPHRVILPPRIRNGDRNNTLYRLGRSLNAQELSFEAIHAALGEENQAKCDPPLSDEEVRQVADHVITQPDRADFAASPDSFPFPKGKVGHEKQLFRPLALSRFLVERQDPIVWVVGDYISEGALVLDQHHRWPLTIRRSRGITNAHHYSRENTPCPTCHSCVRIGTAWPAGIGSSALDITSRQRFRCASETSGTRSSAGSISHASTSSMMALRG